jgi:hypothetical protein
MIHRLGIKSIPVDESWNGCCAESTRSSIECIPISALRLHGGLSTRLFQ